MDNGRGAFEIISDRDPSTFVVKIWDKKGELINSFRLDVKQEAQLLNVLFGNRDKEYLENVLRP